MEFKKTLIKRNVAGDHILVPTGKTILNTTGLFVLNEVGAFIWDLIPTVDTEAQILEAVLQEFDVPAQEAEKDIADFLAQLKQMEIL